MPPRDHRGCAPAARRRRSDRCAAAAAAAADGGPCKRTRARRPPRARTHPIPPWPGPALGPARSSRRASHLPSRPLCPPPPVKKSPSALPWLSIVPCVVLTEQCAGAAQSAQGEGGAWPARLGPHTRKRHRAIRRRVIRRRWLVTNGLSLGAPGLAPRAGHASQDPLFPRRRGRPSSTASPEPCGESPTRSAPSRAALALSTRH